MCCGSELDPEGNGQQVPVLEISCQRVLAGARENLLLRGLGHTGCPSLWAPLGSPVERNHTAVLGDGLTPSHLACLLACEAIGGPFSASTSGHDAVSVLVGLLVDDRVPHTHLGSRLRTPLGACVMMASSHSCRSLVLFRAVGSSAIVLSRSDFCTCEVGCSGPSQDPQESPLRLSGEEKGQLPFGYMP